MFKVIRAVTVQHERLRIPEGWTRFVYQGVLYRMTVTPKQGWPQAVVVKRLDTHT